MTDFLDAMYRDFDAEDPTEPALAAPLRDDSRFDRHPAGLTDACATAPPSHFTQEQFTRDPGRVIAYADEHGTAAIVNKDGKPKFVIGTPSFPALDAPVAAEPSPKPCCARLDSAFGVSWCCESAGHKGSCSGPPARLIELDDLGPKRRRWP